MNDDLPKIDLNTADVDALAQLPGIGRLLAERIVEYRETVHLFADAEELTAVPGISANMVAEFAHLVGTGEVETEIEAEDEVIIEAGEPEAIAPEDETEPLEPEPVEPEAEIVETAVASEPVAAVAASPPPEPVSPPSPPPQAKQKRTIGCGLWLFGIVLGALLGSALTLFFLFTLNEGNLRHEASDRKLQEAVRQAVETREALGAELNDMGERESYFATRVGEIYLQQQAGDETLTAVTELIDEMDGELATLESDAVELTGRVDKVAESSEDFDLFLTSLRDLLIEMQGAPPTATPEPSPSPTPSGEDMTMTPTLTPTAVAPTRTPRPTMTPLATLENEG